MRSTQQGSDTVTPLTGIAYALPVVPVLVLGSSNNVLSGIYATYHGLSLASISMVMLIAGLFDAITDPSIGYLSDRYHAHTGSRRPFVIGGALLLIPCAWFLLNPGEGVTIAYFLVWYLLFYLAMTLFQIPHLTLGGELFKASEQKTIVYGYRNYAGYAGMIIFSLIPLLPFSEGTKVTPETMRYLVVVAGFLLLPTLYLFLRDVPISKRLTKNDPVSKCTTNVGVKSENPFRAILALSDNKPLLWLIGIMVFNAVAGAFYIGLKFLMMDAYLGLGSYYVHFLLLHLISASLAIKPAMRVITTIGKLRAIKVWGVLSVAAFMTLSLVLLNNAATLLLFVFFNIIWAFCSAIGNVAIYSLLSDVADYGTLKSGVDRSAMCFSVHSLTTKTGTAIGISLSIGLAGLMGFDPSLEQQGEQVYWALFVCMSVIPSLLSLLVILFSKKVAITEQRHAIIRRRLDARAIRLEHMHNQPSVNIPSERLT